MFSGIHIVEHGRSSTPSGAEGVSIAANWRCARRTSWESFAPEQLRTSSDTLLIANAVPGTQKTKEFFLWLRDNPAPIPVFAILPDHNNELLQAAMDTVDDFLIWPVRPEELNRRIARLVGPGSDDAGDIPASLAAEIGLRQMVGRDPAFLKVLERIAQFGVTDAPVLLTGETGTGKELCARVMHLLSPRRQGPFLPLDCGALPDHLFENEVFGHTRGAFTDARSDQKGLVALAQRGTLFIDEIDSLSASAQSKVLRLLQEHTYRPLGADSYRQADVRIIAATNRTLESLVANHQFRSDLFFRINVLRIHLPPLRERRSDIALLSRHFIDEICKAANLPKKVLGLAAMRKLDRHDWPGNLRELHNIMQRAVLCSPGTQIAASAVELGEGSDAAEAGGEGACGGAPQPFRAAKLEAIHSFERRYVKQMLEKHEGNVTRAAREAGKDRRAFGRLAKKYNVPPTA
jgi:DNA-binding NtrC family response regulator